jgi:hypothetical protein
MKIVNIDAKEEDLREINLDDICRIVCDAVSLLEQELGGLKGINELNLLNTIPINLKDNGNDENEEGIIELLGAYYPRTIERNPYIELFVSPIKDSAKGDVQQFKWLFIKVLIHEFSHALFDINNYKKTGFVYNMINYYTEYGRWREESMANALALRVIKEYGDTDFYEYAKSFMLSQPPEYALGVLMEDFSSLDYKRYIDSKERGVNNDLKQIWLKYVKNGNPTPNLLKKWNVVFWGEYAYYFKENYYSSVRNLVPSTGKLVVDIVMDKLNKFENEHGRKMTEAEFTDAFPNNIEIETVTKWVNVPHIQCAYEFDSRPIYEYKIELKDGICYLASLKWNNDNLHKFLGKNRYAYGFTEYQNY